MIKVNFTDGVEVMTSSTHLYQWDSNQEITISGLNIANASVHFTNKKRNDAIVVNGTRNNNSLVADIPNILLEDDLDIIAYVHVVASNKGNTIKVVKIPKIARQKPTDYQFTQNIEIMNFERLQKDFNDLSDECHEVLDQIQRELITVDGEGAESDGSHSVIKPRRATFSEWVNANAVLADGEIAVEVPANGVGTGISKIKIGDGTTPWNDLPYAVDDLQGAIDELKGTIGYSKKQLIPYPYDALVTENGMVFTDLGDGRIEVNGSNPNGTSSYYLHYANSKYKPNFNNSKVTLSLKSVSGQASVFFRLWGEGGTYIKEYDFAIDRKNGSLTIDMPNETDYSYATIELFYYQGSTVTNDIVEIMIRYASIEDDTYERYVPSVNGEFGTWTPIASQAPADRNYYIKTKNMLHIWFTVVPNRALTNSNQDYVVCSDVKKAFGIKSFKDAFAYVYASNFAPIKVFASTSVNCLSLQYSGTEVSTAYAIYGQITLCIDQ